MLMLKREQRNVVREVCLCSLVMLALLISANIASGADVDVAICTLLYPSGTDVEVVPEIEGALQGEVDVQLFGEDDLDALADWVEAHTSGQNHILILTGILPTTIYPGGHTEPDDSLVEEFLDAGNTIISTGGYFGYTIEGGVEGVNEQFAFSNVLDVSDAVPGVHSDWENWPTTKTLTPTADGEKYTPTFVEYETCFPMHTSDFEGTPWEPELILADNDELAGDLRFDGVMVNPETGGRFGIFVQTYPLDPCGDVAEWRGDVIGEYILNYHLTEVAAVQSDGKMVSAWGEIKRRQKPRWRPRSQ